MNEGFRRMSDGRRRGFTLVELAVTISLIGVLSALAVPNYLKYQQKADYAALQATLDILMDAQDRHMAENGTYYPQNGVIAAPSGKKTAAPGLEYTFPQGHKHRFYLYGYKRQLFKRMYDCYYIIVYADEDYNSNGRNDVFYCLTYMIDGRFYSNRQLYHLQ